MQDKELASWLWAAAFAVAVMYGWKPVAWAVCKLMGWC
jgi:hypothetical protein